MKILQIISEEIIPLSSKKQVILLLIIASVFQFVLFYTPALADEAVNQAKAQSNEQEMLITNDSVAKDPSMAPEAAKLSGSTLNSTTLEMASTTPAIATSTLTTSTLAIPAVATSTIATSTPDKATSTPKIKVISTSEHVITAYNSDVAQTDSDPCTTANGFNVCRHDKEDTIAANFLKFGTKVKIPSLFGNRIFIVRDRMNSKHPERVDVWMKHYKDAINFGIRVADIQVVK